MSSTGVRDSSSTEKRVIKGLILNEAQFIQSLRVFANSSTLSGLGVTGGDSNNSPLEASGNYLAKSGDIMIGQLGNEFDTIAATNIENDTLDVSKTSGVTFPVVILQGELLADDDLVTITQGEDVFPFQELVIRTRVNIITVKNSDNINTPDGNDLVLSVGSIIHLYFDTFLGEWVIDGGTPFFGSGGVSFPIDFPELDTGSPTVSITIDFADSDRHFRAIELSDDLVVDLINIPAAGALCTIYFTQDGVGGHVPTIPLLDNQDELSNIDTTAGGTTVFTIQAAFSTVLGFTSGKNIFFGSSVANWANFPAVADIVAKGAGDGMSNIGHLDFINNAATPVAAVSLYSDGTDLFANTGGGVVNLSDTGEFFGPWTANHDAGAKSLTNLALAQIVDIGSVVRGSISGDVTTGLTLATASGGKLSIQDVITPIATFEDSVGLTIEGTHVINMSQNIINTIGQAQFDRAVAFSPTVETGISFDNTLSALNYNVGLTSDIHAFRAAGELLVSITRFGSNLGQVSAAALIAADATTPADSILQTNGQLFFADSATDPTLNGQFRRNGTDVKVFTGGAVVNLTGLDPTQIIDGNTFALVLDSAPSFVVTLDGVQKYSISNTRADYEDLEVFGMTQLSFNDVSGPSTPRASFTTGVQNFDINLVDTLDILGIFIGGDNTANFVNSGFQLLSNTPNTTSPVLNFFRDDPSPASGNDTGVINFSGRDSAANFTTYALIAGGIVDPTNGIETGVIVANLLDAGTLVQQLRIQLGELIVRKFTSLAPEQAVLNLVRQDASPAIGDMMGAIEFTNDDTGVFRTFASIEVNFDDTAVGDDSANMAFSVLADNVFTNVLNIRGRATSERAIIELSNGSVVQAASGGVMGVFVNGDTDTLTALGTQGTMHPPFITGFEPDAGDLDTAFGAFPGAIGTRIDTGEFFVRRTDGDWEKFTGTLVT